MKTEQIIDTLQEYNDWRRSRGKWDVDAFNAGESLFDTISAHEIGLTLDAAIEQLHKLEQERDQARQDLQGVKLRLASYQRKYDDAIAYEHEEDRKLERQIGQLKKERDEARAYWRDVKWYCKFHHKLPQEKGSK